jgi:hypothetical protein
MKTKEEKQNQLSEEEDSELMNVEELMDIQGGIEADEDDRKGSCGLGCYIGSGGVGEPEENK